MKRHPALVPLSHDHQHTLADALRLRRAAASDSAEERQAAAQAFLARFQEVARHFREEEELVFPLLARDGEPPPELAEALGHHARIRALAGRLAAAAPGDLAELGELLEQHIRLEERVLFERVQELAADALPGLALAPPAEPVIDLAHGTGAGPLWGTATEDLNATFLAWPPGRGTPEHVNAERDVLVIVLAGSGEITLDGEAHAVRAPQGIVIPKGAARRIAAGPAGIRYLTAHLRRGGLMPKSAA